MTRTFLVRISGSLGCAVMVSDEPWKGDLAVTGPEAVTPERITAAARRKLGLPLIIMEKTDEAGQRLCLRELTEEDLPALRIAEAAPEEAEFRLPDELRLLETEELRAYIRSQYRFFEFGIWGLFLEETPVGLVGFAAGDGEGVPQLGYHIFYAYRRKGYAYLAAREALRYYRDEVGGEEVRIVIRRGNEPSIRLADKLKASLPEIEGRFRISIDLL